MSTIFALLIATPNGPAALAWFTSQGACELFLRLLAGQGIAGACVIARAGVGV